MKFDNFIKICNYLTKFIPDKYPMVNNNSFKKSLLIETRKLDHNEFVIKNTIQKLSDGWGHIIYCSEENHAQIKNIVSQIGDNIDLRILNNHIDRNSYNNMLLDINFWNDIDCQKVLIYQTDTFIFNKFNDIFLDYDYIGANWGPSEHSKNMINIINNNLNKNYSELFQGNGGLSFRNVNLIKSALVDDEFKKLINIVEFDINMDKIPEDIYFALYTSINGKYLKNANLFSIEPGPYRNYIGNINSVFGSHKVYDFNNYHQDILINYIKKYF